MKNTIFSKLLCVIISLVCVQSVYALAPEWEKRDKVVKVKADGAEQCQKATSSAELNINNVRSRINTNGTMWYNGTLAYYYVPAAGNSTSIFCGALWVGGQDENKQLRVAAMRFGQNGSDFWPGPLTIDGNASTNRTMCNEWDKVFAIKKQEVLEFVNSYNETTGQDLTKATKAIREYPAHGATGQSKYLAPFFDRGGDGDYNWEEGDYPYYDFENELCPVTLRKNLKPGEKYEGQKTQEQVAYEKNGEGMSVTNSLLVDQVLKGDQTLWWIINDKGAAHTESKSENSIGLEIRAQSFAFTTNDEVNNMTFCSYEIINRSTYTFTQAYFSQWLDPDLGYADDDYVGCDVERGLGYCYNGKNIDGPGTGAYAGNPPAVGIDFFQGPYMNKDGKDNPKLNMQKMKDNFSSDLQNYALKDVNQKDSVDAQDNVIYDTIQLSAAAQYKYQSAWYFEKDDSVGNCAINGVNFGNGIVDDERFGMRRFVYYNNRPTLVNGEPDKATDYYNYLRGFWRNGSRMVFGGNGVLNADGASTTPCDFMFPAKTDQWNWGTNGVKWTDLVPDAGGWTEQNAGNPPGDRRFMQSAGPFTLEPGAVNYITIGIPWAQASTGDPMASVDLLRIVDDKCQALFDNCFDLLEGPDAPTMVAQELSREVILYLTYKNAIGSNNFGEKYSEEDPTIPRNYSYDDHSKPNAYTYDTVYTRLDDPNSMRIDTIPIGWEQIDMVFDRDYHFEGYQIFQLKNKEVSIADIYDIDRARLVVQCDVENFYDSVGKTRPISKLINYTRDNSSGALVPQVMVDGNNAGISHTFSITEDKFATGRDKVLVNNKVYYYIVVAYAQNEFKRYDPEDALYVDGQKVPYLAGRKAEFDGSAITSIAVMPHDPSPENAGTILQSSYGTSPQITRVEGRGNGGIYLELTKESKDAIMQKPSAPYFIEKPVYEKNFGPLNIKIIDPLNVKEGSYSLAFQDTSANSHWILKRTDGLPISDGVDSVISDVEIGKRYEQVFLDLGISIQIEKVQDVATLGVVAGNAANMILVNGGALIDDPLLGFSISYVDPSKAWLSGLGDDDNDTRYDWIRAGSSVESKDVYDAYNSVSTATTSQDSLAHVTSDYYYQEGGSNFIPLDPTGIMEGLAWWAPYRLASNTSTHPAFSPMYYAASTGTSTNYRRLLADPAKDVALVYNRMTNLASVDVVLTSDQSKWTRCPVIEMSDQSSVSEGNAKRFQLREHFSVKENGEKDESALFPTGMGWFPGYAINLETGERLNIIFGEDSRYAGTNGNGRDMMWNPTNIVTDEMGTVMGGKHYIYILGSNVNKIRNSSGTDTRTVTSPSYDEGVWAYEYLKALKGMEVQGTTGKSQLDSAYALFSNVMWVGVPLINSKFAFQNPSSIPTDATIKMRVRKTYLPNYTNRGDKSDNPENNDNPLYNFAIGTDLVPLTNQAAVRGEDFKNTLLDKIAVVPNPYYARSGYESSQLDARVRITNLPANTVVTIYAVDGTLIRRLPPSPASGTTLDWDLKNQTGLSIAGGTYLVHCKVPGVGDRVIRWFGGIAPIDLNSYENQ